MHDSQSFQFQIKNAEKSTEPKILQNTHNSWDLCATFGNPQIFSTMAMAMSIYRTHFVFLFTPSLINAPREVKPY